MDREDLKKLIRDTIDNLTQPKVSTLQPEDIRKQVEEMLVSKTKNEI